MKRFRTPWLAVVCLTCLPLASHKKHKTAYQHYGALIQGLGLNTP